jgi:flagellar hook-associated protein 2
LASDATQLSSALQTFVTSYNAAATAIAAQEGTSGGPLNGDPTVTQIADELRQVASYYNSSGSINSLADLGITFNDATGQATFDGGTAISALSGAQITDAFNFVGSATSGLAGFAANFTQYSDPVTGLIQIETSGLSQEDQDLQSQITTKTDQANAVQTALQAQLEAADASIAELQSQQQVLTGSLQALSLVLYGQTPSVIG